MLSQAFFTQCRARSAHHPDIHHPRCSLHSCIRSFSFASPHCRVTCLISWGPSSIDPLYLAAMPLSAYLIYIQLSPPIELTLCFGSQRLESQNTFCRSACSSVHEPVPGFPLTSPAADWSPSKSAAGRCPQTATVPEPSATFCNLHEYYQCQIP